MPFREGRGGLKCGDNGGDEKSRGNQGLCLADEQRNACHKRNLLINASFGCEGGKCVGHNTSSLRPAAKRSFGSPLSISPPLVDPWSGNSRGLGWGGSIRGWITHMKGLSQLGGNQLRGGDGNFSIDIGGAKINICHFTMSPPSGLCSET